jgi:soluble lytic murein transglycosylase-like protein
MRTTILAALLLLVIPYLHIAEPQVERTTVVSEEISFAEARFQAMRLEIQNGLGHVLARKTGLSEKEALEITRVAYRESEAHGVDVFRTMGFIVAESYGQREAISPVGARGLMQIMPQTGRLIAAAHSEPWGGRNSLHDIQLNIRYGVWYYRDLLEIFDGDEYAAMAAYNWGPKHIAYRLRRGRALPKVYIGKVLKAEREVREEFRNENRDLIWRSHSRATYILSHRRDTSQSENRPNSTGLPRVIPSSP